MNKNQQENGQKGKPSKGNLPHEALLLSKIVAEKLTVKVTFPDSELLIDQLRWHTPYHLGLKSGKVVNKSAVKYWEIIENK